jgi:hypothetical protein
MTKKKTAVDERKRGTKKVRVYPRDAENNADYDWNDKQQDWLNGALLKGTLDQVVQNIMDIPVKLGISPIGCYVDLCDAYGDDWEVYTTRPETDAEYAARMKKLDAAEAKELKLLAQLQAKYKTKKAA